MKRAICLGVAIIWLMTYSLMGQTLTPSGNRADDWIKAGDRAYEAFDNKKALEAYKKAVGLDPSNYEALWKLSRAYVDVGETLQDKDEKIAYFKEAEKYARRAIEVNPEGSKGHLSLSIAIGRIALVVGPKERVRLSKVVKAEVDRALELDPNDDIAWHVLGRWHRRLATLSWIEKKFANLFLGGVPKEASVEEAARCFQKAIELNPRYIRHYVELGITLLELKREKEARQAFEKALELPITDADDPRLKALARFYLRKIHE